VTRPRLAAAAVVAALAGAGCILLGRAVLAERSGIAAERAALAAPRPLAPVVPGGGIASTLIGDGGERAALRAANDALRAHTLAAATRAEAELASLAAAGSGDRRAWAGTLAGVLEVEQAQLGGAAAQQQLGAALAAFQAAVAADPTNEDAKRNLELLLTLEQQRKKRPQQQQPSGRRAKAAPQAGRSSPGWGW
jgi:hypothetical protein